LKHHGIQHIKSLRGRLNLHSTFSSQLAESKPLCRHLFPGPNSQTILGNSILIR
jgi:hypothetical protein